MNQPTSTVLVSAASWEADGVLALTLADPRVSPLPEWSAGAHVDLHLPSGLVRQFSLCGDPVDPSYRIAVQLDPASRGGSREVHETQLLGRELQISLPRNNFQLLPAERYLFLAGGIGITPLVPMLRSIEAAGTPWHLVYGARTLSAMPFRDELSARCGGTLELLPEDTCGRPDVQSLVRELTPGTAIYCCGPTGLLDAAEAAVRDNPTVLDLHVERFTATAQPAPRKGTFEVELRRQGVVLEVPPHRSILQVVREVLPDVDYSCEEGVCGTCETAVLEGTPEHRDSVLTAAERSAGEVMMICVGRSSSPRLVLDL